MTDWKPSAYQGEFCSYCGCKAKNGWHDEVGMPMCELCYRKTEK